MMTMTRGQRGVLVQAMTAMTAFAVGLAGCAAETGESSGTAESGVSLDGAESCWLPSPAEATVSPAPKLQDGKVVCRVTSDAVVGVNLRTGYTTDNDGLAFDQGLPCGTKVFVTELAGLLPGEVHPELVRSVPYKDAAGHSKQCQVFGHVEVDARQIAREISTKVVSGYVPAPFLTCQKDGESDADFDTRTNARCADGMRVLDENGVTTRFQGESALGIDNFRYVAQNHRAIPSTHVNESGGRPATPYEPTKGSTSFSDVYMSRQSAYLGTNGYAFVGKAAVDGTASCVVGDKTKTRTVKAGETVLCMSRTAPSYSSFPVRIAPSRP